MFPLFYINECLSTNDDIINYLKDNGENLALYTFNQTKGKGQYGNTWESPVNQNLAYSLALKSTESQLSDSLFNFCTAVILRRFLDKLTRKEVDIKWPNDMILNGKKISGMLIEKKKVGGEIHFIIGIGINVLQTDFRHLPKAGSLFTQTGIEFDLKGFTEKLHSELSEGYLSMRSEDEILEEFNAYLFRKDKISVFEKEGVRQNGIIKYADTTGFLWIDLENEGLQKFYHKEIELLY